MTLLTQNKHPVLRQQFESVKVLLDEGVTTTLHIGRYPKKEVKTRLVAFSRETCLLDWCQESGVQNAMGGAFFLRDQHKLLGDLWINGKKQDTVPFSRPWNGLRGCFYINPAGDHVIAPRYLLPQAPITNLLQAGPVLLMNGKIMIKNGVDPEGFSKGAAQFDSDITKGRYPRAAVGMNQDFIFSVVCDGYGRGEAGLTFMEFAQVLKNLGAVEALNLDGGSSSCLINDGKLRNRSMGNHPKKVFERGRPIYSAIIFEKLS